ncbi:MAG: helix-turn-helix transcriptional regulator [Ruminococcaceae bacterium]|nr:helix-turn-helix transcriptional regulator [Oscillospiraceae bacterium]
MDQIKIGKFISERRKSVGLTQAQLAERLNITDRAISKWENGRTMPDSSLMIELCEILGISVNDLLYGEIVSSQCYNNELENALIEAVKEKQSADKRLLSLEVFIGITGTITLFVVVLLASLASMENWLRIAIIVFGFIIFLASCFYALRINQIVGYYECKKCGHKYVPTYKAVNLAPHMGRTRYMKCPKCGEKSWQKKTLNKE